MDPLTASIVAVAGAGLQLSTRLYDVAQQIKSAPETISEIAKEMSCYCKLLRQFGEMLLGQENLYTKELMDTVKDLLWQFEETISKLGALLSACSRGYKRVKFVFRANRIKGAQKRIKRLSNMLSLAILILNLAKTKQENRSVATI